MRGYKDITAGCFLWRMKYSGKGQGGIALKLWLVWNKASGKVLSFS